MFKSIKRWLPLAGLLTLLWLGAYTTFWLDRVGCAAGATAGCLGNALGNWLGDVVMMGWVDTTLAAGALALAGAGLVIVAARYQRHTSLIDARENRRATLLAHLGLASLRFDKLMGHLLEDRQTEAAEAIVAIEANLSDLVSGAPGFAHWLQMVLKEIDKNLERKASSHDDLYPNFWRTKPDIWKALAYSAVAEAFLHRYERLVDDAGWYRHKPGDLQLITSRLGRLSKLTLDDLPLASGMFAA